PTPRPRGAPRLRQDRAGGTRTCNLPVNSRPLCPLSYTPSAGLVSTPAAGAPAYLLAAPPAPSPLSNLTVREGGIKPGVTRLDPPCSTPCTRGKPPGAPRLPAPPALTEPIPGAGASDGWRAPRARPAPRPRWPGAGDR